MAKHRIVRVLTPVGALEIVAELDLVGEVLWSRNANVAAAVC